MSFDAVFVLESVEGITMDKLSIELVLVATEVASGSIVVYGLTNFVIFVRSLTSLSFVISEKAEEIRTKSNY